MVFGAGTLAEGFVTLFGWEEPVFRGWYIVGALLGGAPLAQGSVYVDFSRRTADRMALGLVLYVALAAAIVLTAPVDASAAEGHLLSGKVFEWQWVRLFSPLVNTYAFIFLAGGAALSAYRFSRSPETERRALGNVLIAVGAILPGIRGGFTRAGYTQVIYVTELIGLTLIYLGYRLNVAKRLPRRVEGALEAPASAH